MSYIFGLNFYYLNNIPGTGNNFQLGLETFDLEISLSLSVVGFDFISSLSCFTEICFFNDKLMFQ